MNSYSELKHIVEEIRGTESEAMKNIADVTAKLKARKVRVENARAAAEEAKKKKKDRRK